MTSIAIDLIFPLAERPPLPGQLIYFNGIRRGSERQNTLLMNYGYSLSLSIRYYLGVLYE